MINPDKYIRTAYISALKAATGLPVFAKVFPSGNTAKKYIIIDSQSKSRIVRAKVDYYEWQCRINVNIYSVVNAGTSNPAIVSDIEEQVQNTINSGIPVENFFNKNTDLISAQDLSLNTQTTSIDRSLLIYEHWLCEKPTTT